MITIELTLEQIQNLMGVLDAGVRATGLKGAAAIGSIIPIFEKAVENHHLNQQENKDGNPSNS